MDWFDVVEQAAYNVFESRLIVAMETGNKAAASEIMWQAMHNLSPRTYQRLEQYAYNHYGETF